MTESEINQSLRPECFRFAMDFLGDPEKSDMISYIEQLEEDNIRFKQLAIDLARVLWQMQDQGWINCESGDEQEDQDCDHWRSIGAGLVKKVQEKLL
jgi:hypothetical protein